MALAPQRLAKHRRAAAFFLPTMILGPDLVVKTLFKDQWGRARPAKVEHFGGTSVFTPAWVVCNQCKKNCSFVCGNASVGFALLAIGYVSRRPRFWLATGLVAGGFIGVMRMGQGGHFLGDVVYSADSIRDRSNVLHRKSGCMAAIFAFPKSPI